MKIFAVLLLGLAAFAVAPVAVDRYYVTLLIPFFAYAIALLGLNLLFGYGGLLSFGHSLFLALGAYVAALVTGTWGIRYFEIVILLAVGTSAIVAVPLGAICVRRSKIFFGMLTLAFGMLFHSFLFKFYALTGGDEGMPVRRPALFGQTFTSLDQVQFITGPFYYYCLVLTLAAGFLMWKLVNSPFGLHLKAARDNEQKAEYVGVATRKVRLVAFIVSAVYCSIGGAILGVNTGLADPEIAYWTQSGNLVFMTVLGGFGNFLGPPIGAFAFILLQDYLASNIQYWRFVLGALLAVFVVVLPQGISGLATRLLQTKSRTHNKMQEAEI